MVPEHHAVARCLECTSLEHPAAQTQCVAVTEHHRRHNHTVERRRGSAFRFVDLNMKLDTVGGDDDDFGACLFFVCIKGVQRLGRLACTGQTISNNTYCGRSSRRGESDAEAGECPTARPDHCWPPTWIRGTRAPIRVTISYEMVPAACAQSCAVGSPDSPEQNRVTTSPARASLAGPRSTMNWSMQTRPEIVCRTPARLTGPTFVALRGMPSA